MVKRKVGRPKTSDRLRLQFLLTVKHKEVLTAIAIQKELKVNQGSYKDQPNLNAAIIWLIENYKE